MRLADDVSFSYTACPSGEKAQATPRSTAHRAILSKNTNACGQGIAVSCRPTACARKCATTRRAVETSGRGRHCQRAGLPACLVTNLISYLYMFYASDLSPRNRERGLCFGTQPEPTVARAGASNGVGLATLEHIFQRPNVFCCCCINRKSETINVSPWNEAKRTHAAGVHTLTSFILTWSSWKRLATRWVNVVNLVAHFLTHSCSPPVIFLLRKPVTHSSKHRSTCTRTQESNTKNPPRSRHHLPTSSGTHNADTDRGGYRDVPGRCTA